MNGCIDGWMEVRGPKEGCSLVKEIFADLEEARRNGGEVTSRGFRTAVDLVKRGDEGDFLYRHGFEFIQIRLRFYLFFK